MWAMSILHRVEIFGFMITGKWILYEGAGKSDL